MRQLVGVVAACVAAAIMLAGAALLVWRDPIATGIGPDPTFAAGFVLAVLAYLGSGAVLVRRRPDNAVSWVVLAVGVLLATSFGVEEYAIVGLEARPRLPGAVGAAWLSYLLHEPGLVLASTYLFLLFPTGAPPSRRWRPLVWLAALGGLAVVIAHAFEPIEMTLPLSGVSPRNPLGITAAGGLFTTVHEVSDIVTTVAGLGSLLSLFARFRRGDAVVRAQVKWYLLAGLVLGSALLLSPLFEAIPYLAYSFVLGIAAIPVAAGIAVTRYRLFDIDVVINKAIVYAVLTALLAGVYVLAVFVLQRLVAPFAGTSDLTVAASTLAVAALFRPLRSRIQRVIDHRFYRRRYDALRTLDAFALRLRDDVDVQSLATEVLAVVRETVQPAQVSLWLRPSEESVAR